jgi:pyridoxal phosphate enzyme (YggS family)
MTLDGLRETHEAIARAARAHGRAPNDVTLIAVSKTMPMERIEPVLASGQFVFGENYVQEADAKWSEVKRRLPGIELHLVGPLQTNKVKQAVALFDAIHSLDRESLAQALAKDMRRQGRRPQLFVQVNTGREPQKAGVMPEEADLFIARCRETHGLTIEGLMCIPPAGEDPVPHFRLLREMAARNAIGLLSMGMSADFEAAIAEGATHVRVGTAIFGARG